MMEPEGHVPWVERPSLDVDLNQPVDQRFRHAPPEAVAQTRQLLEGIKAELALADESMADAAHERTGGRFKDEAEAFAAAADVSAQQIMLANLSYDLSIAMFACSTIALATPDGPILARNMDWWPEGLLARASWCIRSMDGDECRYQNLGWPGAIGVVTGISSHGFALAINAVIGPEGLEEKGYPVLLHLRRVLEDATDFDEAVGMVSDEMLTVPALITIVGAENHERVVIERSPKRHAVRAPADGEPLVTTNDYRALFRPRTHMGAEIYQTTCARFDRLNQLLKDHHGDRPATDAELLYYLTDIRVIQGITAQHAVMRPRTGEAHLYVPRRLLEVGGESNR